METQTSSDIDYCKKCGSSNLYIEHGPVHHKLLCSDCGAYQKFVKQDKNVDAGEIASDAQQKYAISLMKKWERKNIQMTARQAGAIIQAFKENAQ